MRDPSDLMTAELPEIEPLPPTPLDQLPQAARREALQFQGPKQRPRCGACKHIDVFYLRPDSPTEAERMRCKLADFPVQAGAICVSFVAQS